MDFREELKKYFWTTDEYIDDPTLSEKKCYGVADDILKLIEKRIEGLESVYLNNDKKARSLTPYDVIDDIRDILSLK